MNKKSSLSKLDKLFTASERLYLEDYYITKGGHPKLADKRRLCETFARDPLTFSPVIHRWFTNRRKREKKSLQPFPNHSSKSKETKENLK